MTLLAFAPTAPLLGARGARYARADSLAPPRAHARARVLVRRAPARMAADDGGGDGDAPPEGGEAEDTTSASEILKTLRETSAADNSPSKRSMLGVYRDVDGKSNVWAVEPLEETDTKPQISKTVLIVAAAAFIVVTLLVLPLLPFTNPDQV